MNMKRGVSAACLALGLACAAVGVTTQQAGAVPVSQNVWYEFGFGNPVGPLTSGAGTVLATAAPDGHPIVQVGNPAWTDQPGRAGAAVRARSVSVGRSVPVYGRGDGAGRNLVSGSWQRLRQQHFVRARQ